LITDAVSPITQSAKDEASKPLSVEELKIKANKTKHALVEANKTTNATANMTKNMTANITANKTMNVSANVSSNATSAFNKTH
jgi:hypothetical protein